jgi:hypothetical protein
VEISISDDQHSSVAKTDSPLPAHFSINFEARQVASKNYPLAFSNILPSPVRFSFERDILYFEVEKSFELFMMYIPDETKDKIRHLMLARDADFLYEPKTIHCVREFLNLKSITLESADTVNRPNAGRAAGRTVTMGEKLCYNRQLQALRKAQTLFSMGELMGNMLWKWEMQAVAKDYKLQWRPIFEQLRKAANASKLRSLDCE